MPGWRPPKSTMLSTCSDLWSTSGPNSGRSIALISSTSTPIGPEVDMHVASPIVKETGLAREKQVGPGAVITFNSNYSNYMALFWNNEFSNTVVWVPDGPNYLERVAQTGATWTYAAYGDPVYAQLHAKDSGWVEVGPLQVERWGVVFRRTRW